MATLHRDFLALLGSVTLALALSLLLRAVPGTEDIHWAPIAS